MTMVQVDAPPRAEVDPLSILMSLWMEIFPDAPIRARDLLNHAVDHHPMLLDALAAVVPSLSEHPHPPTLTRWLDRIENLPIQVGDDRYRVSRVGHRWAVVRFARPTQV